MNSSRGLVRATGTVPLLDARLQSTGPPGAAADERPPETRLTPEVAQEICERTDGTVVLEGSIQSLGSQYILWIHARRLPHRRHSWPGTGAGGRKEGVLHALTEMVVRIKARLENRCPEDVQERSTPLEQATTASLEALKAYSDARKAVFTRRTRTRFPICNEPLRLTRNSPWRRPI